MSEKPKTANGREIDKPVETVLGWLKECRKDGIKPWEYDFKYEIYYKERQFIKDKKEENKHVELLLETWKDDEKFSKKTETEDCVLAQCIYKILWDTHSKNAGVRYAGVVDADVMNSFWITFKNYLRNTNKVFVESGIGNKHEEPFKSDSGLGNAKEKFELKHGNSFKLNKETLNTKKNFWLSFILDHLETFLGKDKPDVVSKFENFAKLTHTIGNFTLVTKGYNTSRGGNDYWDHGLEGMEKQAQQTRDIFGDGFKYYEDKFFMSYYIKDGKVETLMNQEKLKNKEEAEGEILSFLEKVNEKIEARGKKMIEVLLQEILFSEKVNDKEDIIILESYKEELFGKGSPMHSK